MRHCVRRRLFHEDCPGLPGYLQVLQFVLLQEVQPDETAEVPARGFSVPVEQNTENFFFTFFELHLGQLTSWPPKTSFSKFSPQPVACVFKNRHI